jgi:hypothetical protein
MHHFDAVSALCLDATVGLIYSGGIIVLLNPPSNIL